MRDQGPYSDRSYFKWKNQKSVSPPKFRTSMDGAGWLRLEWTSQQNARVYEVQWSTENQACNEFVTITETSSTEYLIEK